MTLSSVLPNENPHSRRYLPTYSPTTTKNHTHDKYTHYK